MKTPASLFFYFGFLLICGPIAIFKVIYSSRWFVRWIEVIRVMSSIGNCISVQGFFCCYRRRNIWGKTEKEYSAYLTPGDDATSYPPSIYSFTTNMAKTLRKVGPQFNLRLFLSTHSTPPHCTGKQMSITSFCYCCAGQWRVIGLVIEWVFHYYLMENPEILLENIQNFAENKFPGKCTQLKECD